MCFFRFGRYLPWEFGGILDDCNECSMFFFSKTVSKNLFDCLGHRKVCWPRRLQKDFRVLQSLKVLHLKCLSLLLYICIFCYYCYYRYLKCLVISVVG